VFDLQRFEKKLRSQLTGTTVGYEYAIYQNQVLSGSGAGGYAAISSQTRMTADRRMTIASMTKTVTAVAFMRALEISSQAGGSLTIDSKISPYLPTAWPRGRLVNELTFKNLLTHYSGLRGVEDEDLFESLEQTIGNGSILTDFGPEYNYQNCNYSLFRILIPTVLYGVAVSDQPDNSALEAEIKALQAELEGASPTEKAQLIAQIEALRAQIEERDPARRTAKLYYDFVRHEVLGRVGLGTVSLAPRDAQEAVLEYYNFNDTSKIYKDPDFTWHLLRVGAGHWYMSAKELGRFIAGLRNAQIISNSSFQQMSDNSLGMGSGSDSTRGGKNWEHGGGFENNGAGMSGTWMILPNGWTATILVNSQGGMKKSIRDVIRNAFNAAWLSPPITNVGPAATSLGGRIYAFIKADDNRIYLNPARAGQPFNGWMEVEGNGTTDVPPAPAYLGDRVYVFAKGIGDRRIYVNSAVGGQPFDGWGDGWGGIVRHDHRCRAGGGLTGRPHLRLRQGPRHPHLCQLGRGRPGVRRLETGRRQRHHRCRAGGGVSWRPHLRLRQGHRGPAHLCQLRAQRSTL